MRTRSFYATAAATRREANSREKREYAANATETPRSNAAKARITSGEGTAALNVLRPGAAEAARGSRTAS